MKPHHSFVAERIAAQHCQELLRRQTDPAELIPALDRLGEHLAARLGPGLAALLGGAAPALAALPAHEIGKAELIEAIGPLAANALLACAIPRLGLVSAIGGRTVLRLVDRAFGGRGDAAGALPVAFPLSAELMIERLEKLVVECLAETFGLPDLRISARNARLTELARFPAPTRLVALRLSIGGDAASDWQLGIALPLAQLPELLARAGATPGTAARSTTEPRPADPAAAPFADLPLPLTATLVDMQLLLSLLGTLEPGVILPVAVARAVPLSIGEAVLARGSVGAQDERVAIKLSQIA